MTLPTTTTHATTNSHDDDSDMFGPPRTSPLRHNRPRVPMISAKLRMREERKRILQLCAHKLERIKDSETNLRRSVCINNTYSRLTDEVRREKQSRYLANSPKSDNINASKAHSNNFFGSSDIYPSSTNCSSSTTINSCQATTTTTIGTSNSGPSKPKRRSRDVDADLESLDRELYAIDASMPLLDPEITQGAEQLERAISRKRSRSEEDNDRLVREALSQYYMSSPRLLSGIDDCPIMPVEKRCKNDIDFDLNLDHNQNQKEFEVILDALRLSGGNGDSCGQAAMMSESGIFQNLVVASLET